MLPDPLLEGLHAGDGAEETARAGLLARAPLEDIDEALRGLQASDQEILARYPPRVAMAHLEGRVRRRHWRRFSLAGSLLAGAAVLLALSGQLQPLDGPDRPKGPPLLSVLVEGRAAPLPDGALGQEGDRLQLVLDPAGATHAAVVSVDGRGQVTVHFPREGTDCRLPATGAKALDSSFRLDDAPSFEVFYALTSRAPIALEAVLAAAAEGGPKRELPLEGVEQTRFVLRKLAH